MNGYQDVADYIAEQIANGNLQSGTRLPPERQFSKQLKISRLTLRAALIKLEADGLVYGKSRRGWFVSPSRFIYNLGQKANYNSMASAQGRVARIDLLGSGTVTSTNLPEPLRSKSGGEASYLKRVRYLDDRPVMFESIFLVSDAVPDVLGHNLCDSITNLLVRDYGIEIDREETNVRSALLDAGQAAAMGVAPGTHSLMIERLRFANGKLIEFDAEHWLPGAIELHIATPV